MNIIINEIVSHSSKNQKVVIKLNLENYCSVHFSILTALKIQSSSSSQFSSDDPTSRESVIGALLILILIVLASLELLVEDFVVSSMLMSKEILDWVYLIHLGEPTLEHL